MHIQSTLRPSREAFIWPRSDVLAGRGACGERCGRRKAAVIFWSVLRRRVSGGSGDSDCGEAMRARGWCLRRVRQFEGLQGGLPMMQVLMSFPQRPSACPIRQNIKLPPKIHQKHPHRARSRHLAAVPLISSVPQVLGTSPAKPAPAHPRTPAHCIAPPPTPLSKSQCEREGISTSLRLLHTTHD
jgi:hypothetical protein